MFTDLVQNQRKKQILINGWNSKDAVPVVNLSNCMRINQITRLHTHPPDPRMIVLQHVDLSLEKVLSIILTWPHHNGEMDLFRKL
ncbi:hypothetical protein CDAR_418001 [Caerostris darwini]|uniref:Uncharacterized protein n=1 Tax=Caerostris darwini TaxID=1538125 RepID=A0AAV4NJR7_9ARAC|nr:hypothetical protein CDAR_418001 [Caerostris darwini]